MADKKLIIAVIAIAVIAVAAIGIYLIVTAEEKNQYAEYTVSGSAPGMTFDGTMRMTVIGETTDQYHVKYDFKVYATAGGVRTALINESQTEWVDKDDSSGWDMGTKVRTETITTAKWGDKAVDVYELIESGDKTTSYVGVADGVPYKMVMETGGFKIIFDLTKTNMF